MRQGCRAPSASDRVGSGTVSSGSMTRLKPRPVQVGQAPWGALKEKMRGSSSGIEVPHSEAGEVLGEGHPLAVDDLDLDQAVGQRGRSLDRFGEPATKVLLHDQPVDHDRDVVLVLLVERDLVLEQQQLAVHLDP